MSKAKWIIGFSLSGALIFSGTAFALASGTPVSTQVKSLTNQAASNYELSTKQTKIVPLLNNNASNSASIPGTGPGVNPYGSGGYGGAYAYGGMMGGYGGANGYGGMMGGYGGANGYGGMMGGYGGANGYGGMMGGYGGANGYGGMMGGYGGANIYGGMMGGFYSAANLGVNLTNGQVSSSEQAIAIAKAYVQKVDSGLTIDEIHEFADSYEVELKDAQTGEKAYEFIIAKAEGVIFPEMGPNTMWNTKYGHMNWGNTGALTVTEEQATKSAQDFVSQMGQTYTIEKPEIVPGYYEFMILKDGKDYAEVDVNGYTGQVWFENWHGPIISTIEGEQLNS